MCRICADGTATFRAPGAIAVDAPALPTVQKPAHPSLDARRITDKTIETSSMGEFVLRGISHSHAVALESPRGRVIVRRTGSPLRPARAPLWSKSSERSTRLSGPLEMAHRRRIVPPLRTLARAAAVEASGRPPESAGFSPPGPGSGRSALSRTTPALTPSARRQATASRSLPAAILASP